MRLQLYRLLPAPARRLARQAYARLPVRWRFGPVYWATRKLIADAATWDSDRLHEWQWQQLRRVVADAWREVPGYRRRWEAAGISPGDLNTMADFRRLPGVRKADLSADLTAYTSKSLSAWQRIHRTTAGSTGIPFGFHLPADAIDREWAFMHDAWERAGWRLGDRSAVLRGAYIGTARDFWNEDPHLGHLLLSSYHLTPATWPAYRERILSWGADHLQAYPSAAVLLADLVLARPDLTPPPFKIIFLGSENLYDFQRERIARAFPGSRLFSWYGHAEQAVFAPECETSTRLHLSPLYGFTEVVGTDGRTVPEGEIGEIVATSFWNRATPFIRYRTMDFAELGPAACPACGRPHELLNRIEGRLQEMIVTGQGRWISMTAINMHTDIFEEVRQFQFHQRAPGRVTFRLVPKPGYNERAERRIRAGLAEKLGSDTELVIEVVETIAPTRGGKHRFLVQELPLRYGDA